MKSKIKITAILLLTSVMLMSTSCAKGKTSKASSKSNYTDAEVKFDLSKSNYNDIYNNAIKMSHPIDRELGVCEANLRYDKDGNLNYFMSYLWCLRKQYYNDDYWNTAHLSFEDGKLKYEEHTVEQLRHDYNPFGKGNMYLKQFTDTLQAMNIKSLLNEYVSQKPDFYGLYYQYNISDDLTVKNLLNKKVKSKSLYFDGNKFTETNIKDYYKDDRLYMPGKTYFLIVPYYSEAQGEKGFGEITINDKKYYASNILFVVTDV